MLGDLKYGRTVHSLSRLLSLYKVKINLVSPSFLSMPKELIDELQEKGVELTETQSLEGVKGKEAEQDCDVLYITRVQKERINEKVESSSAVHLQNFDRFYAITPEIAVKTRAVMHPLPRVNEVPLEIDNLPQAAYFRQIQNGLYIRMALLSLVLKGG